MYIWNGIKDYLKDVLHDWHVAGLFKIYKRAMYCDSEYTQRLPIVEWKEGSVWYYIRQRKKRKSSQR